MVDADGGLELREGRDSELALVVGSLFLVLRRPKCDLQEDAEECISNFSAGRTHHLFERFMISSKPIYVERVFPSKSLEELYFIELGVVAGGVTPIEVLKRIKNMELSNRVRYLGVGVFTEQTQKSAYNIEEEVTDVGYYFCSTALDTTEEVFGASLLEHELYDGGLA